MRAGEVIACPTEAVYGLSCDPSCESAVRRILQLKQRAWQAGLILIADEFSRLQPWCAAVEPELLERARLSWPGPVTWLFPRAEGVPDWLAGNHSTIAVRVTAHPVCRALCREWGGPVVSTSANRSGEEPARTVAGIEQAFTGEIAGVVEGELGASVAPSEIRDLLSASVIRESS